MRRSSSLAVGLMCVIAASFSIAAPKAGSKKSPSSQEAGESWHKVKSASGTAKTRATIVKFKVSTANWRLKLVTTPPEVNPASSSARIALMVEANRDVDGTPANWSQVEVLTEGKPGDEIVREYDTGLDKDGEPKWFALSVLGYAAKYELVVEDQAPTGKKAKKKD